MKTAITVRLKTRISLSDSQASDVRGAINFQELGTENCNEINKEGKMVSIPMTKKSADFLDRAHRGLMRSREITVAVDIGRDGSWNNIRLESRSPTKK